MKPQAEQHHFKLTGIFGPIIIGYMDPAEQSIIRHYCNGYFMDVDELEAAAYYCVQNDLPNYLQSFTYNPQHVLYAAACQQSYVDFAIANGATYDNESLRRAIPTENIDWILMFKPGCTDYESCMIEAMKKSNIALMRTIFHWDMSEWTNWDHIVSNISVCNNPVAVITLFDNEFDVLILLNNWDAKLQMEVVCTLCDHKYSVNLLIRSTVVAGNLEAFRFIAEEFMDYDELFVLAARHGHVNIMTEIHNTQPIDAFTYTRAKETATDSAIELLKTW